MAQNTSWQPTSSVKRHLDGTPLRCVPDYERILRHALLFLKLDIANNGQLAV